MILIERGLTDCEQRADHGELRWGLARGLAIGGLAIGGLAIGGLACLPLQCAPGCSFPIAGKA